MPNQLSRLSRPIQNAHDNCVKPMACEHHVSIKALKALIWGSVLKLCSQAHHFGGIWHSARQRARCNHVLFRTSISSTLQSCFIPNFNQQHGPFSPLSVPPWQLANSTPLFDAPHRLMKFSTPTSREVRASASHWMYARPAPSSTPARKNQFKQRTVQLFFMSHNFVFQCIRFLSIHVLHTTQLLHKETETKEMTHRK